MPDKISKLAEEMQKAFEHGEKWETKKTSIPGIFLVKMPESELRVSLTFNPLDNAGNPRKRKGFFFSDKETVEAARKAFSDGRLEDLIAAVQKVNGTSSRKASEDEDIFQV